VGHTYIPRTRALDGTLRSLFKRWYPRLPVDNAVEPLRAKSMMHGHGDYGFGVRAMFSIILIAIVSHRAVEALHDNPVLFSMGREIMRT
jgi:hypothetical protein